MNTEIVSHYLHGGEDLDKTYASLRRVGEQMESLPVPVRPLFHVADAVLRFEREMRQGPRWRCSGCGWFSAVEHWLPTAPDCPVCEAAGRPVSYVQRYRSGPLTWPPTVEGREREWVLAVAARCGITLAPAAGGALARAEPVLHCRTCETVLTPAKS